LHRSMIVKLESSERKLKEIEQELKIVKDIQDFLALLDLRV